MSPPLPPLQEIDRIALELPAIGYQTGRGSPGTEDMISFFGFGHKRSIYYLESRSEYLVSARSHTVSALYMHVRRTSLFANGISMCYVPPRSVGTRLCAILMTWPGRDRVTPWQRAALDNFECLSGELSPRVITDDLVSFTYQIVFSFVCYAVLTGQGGEFSQQTG